MRRFIRRKYGLEPEHEHDHDHERVQQGEDPERVRENASDLRGDGKNQNQNQIQISSELSESDAVVRAAVARVFGRCRRDVARNVFVDPAEPFDVDALRSSGCSLA